VQSLGQSTLAKLPARLGAALIASVLASGAATAASSLAQPMDLGATPADAVQTVSLVLKIRNPDQLERYIAATVDPDNPLFRRFLTVEQFRAFFAPREIEILRIRQALHAAGITVDEVFKDHLVIRATGTADQFNRFFSTDLHDYQNRANGKRFRKPARAPSIPTSISDLVLVVTGLSSQPHAHPMLRRNPEASPGAALGDPTRVSLLKGATPTGLPGEFTVGDVVSLYNVAPLYRRQVTGRSRTIGIATLATFDPADAYAYWDAVGLNVSKHRIRQVHVDGGAGTDGADETTLDVQQSGGLAPGAKMIVYDAPNTDDGFLDVFYKAASDNRVDTLSVSWGLPEIAQSEAVTTGQHQAFMELAAQGISVFASSGDAGAYDINSGYPYPVCTKTLTVDAPAADPYVVAAGGTTLPHTQVKKYGTVTVPLERPWAWDYLENYFVTYYGQDFYDANLFPVGGGGGVSVNFARPAYQARTQGVQISAPGQSLVCQSDTGPVTLIDLPAGYRGRNVPDLSLNADPYTGYSVYFQGQWASGYGGTSFVAPQLNGITALLSQQAGSRLGFLNPQLYAQLAQYGYGRNSPFNSITSGDNLYWLASPSYNPASGIGTIDADRLSRTLSRGRFAD
jgi:subtilase family serine protease